MAHALPMLSGEWSQFLALAGYDFLCEVDRAGRYAKVSPNYASLLGLRTEELLGRTPFELGLIHPEDAGPLAEGVRSLFEENRPARNEYRFRAGDGSYRWMESTGSPFQDEAGAWRCLFISRDISQRKATEASLTESEARYRALVEHAVEAILLVDAQGMLLEVNHRACALAGYAQEELLGLPVDHLFPAEELALKPL
ncbi:MAG TPA: PAS domain-containing protein, partial [Holophaga sp.]|nr:PAS domain-containing protein [Holophaga sp.]